MGSVLDFEDKKILFDTIKKILYGIEFDELPPARILRSIEEEFGVVLEFKNHFRYLVPQVYGWEFMDEYMYHDRPFPHKPGEQPERREWIEERSLLRSEVKGMSYYDFCHSVAEANYIRQKRKDEERTWFNERSMGIAVALCEELFYRLVFMTDEIEKEEEYWQEQSKQGAVLDELYSQLKKYLGDNVDWKLYYGKLSNDFIDSLINNKLMKYKDTVSDEEFGLNNFWESYCVQVQRERSFSWQMYVSQLFIWIREEFEQCPMWQRNAIWLDLKDKDIRDYFDDYYDPDESENKGYLFSDDNVKNVDIENIKYYDLKEVTDFIFQKLNEEAKNFTNKAIERYLRRKSYYYDESDEEENEKDDGNDE